MTFGPRDSNGVSNINDCDFTQDLSGSSYYVIIDETNYQNVFVHVPDHNVQGESKFIILGVEVYWNYSTQILQFPPEITQDGVTYNLTT